MVKFLDLQKQYFLMKDEMDKTISDVISSASFIGGTFVEKFEKNFANYCEAKYCIGVANGTDALEIALWSLDLPVGSEVIVPSNSFIATSEAVTRNNLKIKFADCDEYYQMCPDSLTANITENTSAIIVVHLYGHPANMDRILSIKKEYNLKLIEDCAQAHGARYKGKRVGTFGDIATFSFYPGKNLGAYGDGGAIITNNKELEQKSRMYSNHGRSSKFGHEFEGINSRLDGIQAAVLDVKLKYLDGWIQRRQKIAEFYLESLKELPFDLPDVQKNVDAVWHLFVIKCKDRDSLKQLLLEHDIQTGVHYPMALPKLKAYQYIEQDVSHFNSCREDKQLLSLPIGEHLSNDDINKVCDTLKMLFSKEN